MAKFTPVPPIGDIACALSPMHSRPGRCHRRSRLVCTDSRWMSSQPARLPTCAASAGITRPIVCRNRSTPAARTSSAAPLGIMQAACQ